MVLGSFSSTLSSALPTSLQASQNVVICRCGIFNHAAGVCRHTVTTEQLSTGVRAKTKGWFWSVSPVEGLSPQTGGAGFLT